MDEIFIEY